MILTDWVPPLVKALATALLVVSAAAVAETLGPFWAALIATLPVSTGPAYLFLAMQHDADFIAASALSSCAANAATGVFLLTYALLAGRISPALAIGAAVLVWLAAGAATEMVAWTPASAVLLNVAVYSIGFAPRGRFGGAGTPAAPATRRRWFDLPVRAVAVAAFVSLVVTVSALLGPRATGLAAIFPIGLTSLFVMVAPRLGATATALVAFNALRPMLGFGLALLTLHLAIAPWGTAAALAAALLVSASWSASLLLYGRQQRPSRSANLEVNRR